jgi:hypothetical protein
MVPGSSLDAWLERLVQPVAEPLVLRRSRSPLPGRGRRLCYNGSGRAAPRLRGIHLSQPIMSAVKKRL